MNNRIIIYEDDNTKVELDREFHNFIKASQPQFFKLPDEEFDFVLKAVFAILNKEKIFSKDDKSILINRPKLIGNIPIIKSGQALSLQPPYDYFNEILHYLCIYPTLDDEYFEIAKDVNEVFGENGFFCYIFPHRIFDVKGFIVFQEKEKKEYIIMLFNFKD